MGERADWQDGRQCGRASPLIGSADETSSLVHLYGGVTGDSILLRKAESAIYSLTSAVSRRLASQKVKLC